MTDLISFLETFIPKKKCKVVSVGGLTVRTQDLLLPNTETLVSYFTGLSFLTSALVASYVPDIQPVQVTWLGHPQTPSRLSTRVFYLCGQTPYVEITDTTNPFCFLCISLQPPFSVNGFPFAGSCPIWATCSSETCCQHFIDKRPKERKSFFLTNYQNQVLTITDQEYPDFKCQLCLTSTSFMDSRCR